MLEKQIKEQYLKTTSSTFEAFSYDSSVPKNLGCTWDLVATKSNGEKEYAMVFAPRIDGFRNNIRIAQKRISEDVRLVVVTDVATEDEIRQSEEEGYTIVTLGDMKMYGAEMIETIERERAEGREVSEEELNCLMTTKDKIF